MRNIKVRVYPSASKLKKKQQLAWKIAEIASDKAKLNEDAIDMVINRIIDNASVAIASFNRKPVISAREMALAHPRKNGATLFGVSPKKKFDCEWAAWANGTAVRELDFHDTFLAADYSHPGDNIPPILAVAQQKKLSGKDLIRGILTGYEVQVNLVKGICLHEHKIEKDDKPLIITDGALNVLPTVKTKIHILKNVIDFSKRIGNNRPKIAVLSATEEVLDSIQSSMEAKEITELSKKENLDADVFGPLAFDNCISKKSANIKGIKNIVAGEADVLLVPSVETGNALVKMMIYFMGACAAGVVVGGKVPVVITSRSDEAVARLASIAAAVVAKPDLRLCPAYFDESKPAFSAYLLIIKATDLSEISKILTSFLLISELENIIFR